MIKIIIAILFLISYLFMFYAHKMLLIRNKEFTINNTIKLDKKYQIKIETLDKGENKIVKGVRFLEGDRVIDSEITLYKEFNTSYFFKGKEGYYIYNKFRRKLYFAKDLNEFSFLQKRVFNKYFM